MPDHLTITRRTSCFLFAASLGLALAGPAGAVTSPPAPEGPVVLNISGKLTGSDADAQFDMDMLRALPQTRFMTSTIWSSGPQEFAGVSLHHLAERLGFGGSYILASAINDYSTHIPLSDLVEGGPILAYEVNGKELSRREKGPLWIVYPYDAVSAYNSEVIYRRSIWQVVRFELR